MKIVVFTINPIFPDKVTGGASKHLNYITKFLGAQGHFVEILCPKTDDIDSPFNLSKNVAVFPELIFDLPFPQPYAISPPDLTRMTYKIFKRLEGADRFYVHDGEWLLPDVYHAIPSVVSFRDNIYPESILGSFIGKPDEVINVSDYSRAVIENTAGMFFPGLRERLHTVLNGIDFDFFSARDPSHLARRLGINLDNDIVLLHPHRPEEGKGLAETIRVAHRLVHKHGLNNLKVLIPEWIGSMVSKADSAFYNAMMRLMQEFDVEKNFIFTPWLPIERMPELYSLGHVTLCLGNIVEAFGNVAYESLACGTPSIVSRVGVHRTLLTDELIHKVHFGDIEDAVSKILAIIEGEGLRNEEVRDYLKSNMDIKGQVKAYSEIITACQKRERLQFSPPEITDQQVYTLAPWCYFKDDLIYHDFHGGFENASELALVQKKTATFTKLDARNMGISSDLWKHWLEEMWIVPKLY